MSSIDRSDTYFAWGVLTGQKPIDQLDAAGFKQLERVWLEQVKQLSAYHHWQARSGGWGMEPMRRDYLDACEELHSALLDPEIKAAPEGFAAISAYLKSKSRNQLIERKAGRIAENRSPYDQDTSIDWQDAERYVQLFYDNVLAAAQGDAERMREALHAFRGEWREHGVVNSLEAAIAIYYFTPALVQQCCESCKDII